LGAQDVERFREALREAAKGQYGLVTDTTDVAWLSGPLWSYWIAPLLSDLTGADHLLVIPSPPLAGIPLEAVLDSEGAYLSDRFAVSYVPSATLHAWMRERRAARGDPDLALALFVGDPAHPDDRYRPLPETRRAIESLAPSFPGATILLGAQAAEQALMQMASAGTLAEFGLIHLATHAQVKSRFPERSALILARPDLPDPLTTLTRDEVVFDGHLTAVEIVRHWDLSARLVVSCGCKTGLGQEARGEGYLGLTQSFLQAGAQAVLVSLWDVDDEATALFMKQFYGHLSAAGADSGPDRPIGEITAADALRLTRRALRSYVDASGRRPFRHPVYWSAFVLVGGAG
jgi:CHAT domain-containing protein